MAIRLKECPFCGWNAGYITKNICLSNGHISYRLHHKLAGCILDEWSCHTTHESEEEAAEAWNDMRGVQNAD